MTLPPVLAMRPRFVEKLWGGSRLRELPAKSRDGHRPEPSKRTGESWEVADLPEGASVIDGGALEGRTLTDVVREHGRALVGERATPGPDGVLRFPLLVKLIDAGDDLSVQVHPGQDYARTHPGTFSKDEAWLVVAHDPGAVVLHGLRDGVTRDAFVRAIDDGRAHELLRTVNVTVGDVLRIAPGTMHAVGKGCLLLEVQEPSDTTFRVWDYNRLEGGKPRKLHVAQALEVARFGAQDRPLFGDLGRAHLRTERYGMALLDLPERGAVRIDEALGRAAGEPAVVFVLDGEVDLEKAHLPRGASAIVTAAATDVTARARGASRVVVMSTGRKSDHASE